MKATPGDDLPPAPWGSFPLAELTILAGIVMLGIGIFAGSPTALGVGVVLACLGGMEVAIREHLAGYRSHTTLLAGAVFVFLVALLLYAAELKPLIAVAIGAAAFVLAFLALRRAFQRASGGLSFTVGGRRPSR
jgi:uncharacterized integral membrane protein